MVAPQDESALPPPGPVTTGTMLTAGTVVPGLSGVAVAAAMVLWALPTGAALQQRHVLHVNAVAAAVCGVVGTTAAAGLAYKWVIAPVSSGQRSRRALLAAPWRMALINWSAWATAGLIFVLINSRSPWLAATFGVCALVAGTVTAGLTYWLCGRMLRPHVAAELTANPPTRARRPGLRLRATSAWLIGSGMPLVMVLLVASSALAIDYSRTRFAVVVLVLAGFAVLSGLVVAELTAAATVDPINEVRRGMRQVQQGRYDVTIPVFDESDLGMLQAGFNEMAHGLVEREQLRDVFGRHVGPDVARLAMQKDSRADDPTAIGGLRCQAAVLFVDIVASTQMATRLSPEELVATLNRIFAIVVRVIELHRGWVNKFQGDAALAVFGTPVTTPDSASDALAAARELHQQLNRQASGIRVGIGVSAGMVVAGNIGGPRRYEYTVIGDPVNEAARLTELAKDQGGVAASGAVVGQANPTESGMWTMTETRTLRGRDVETDIFVAR